MTDFAFETVDVFTTTRFGGNPLAVVVDARGMDDAAMGQVAREFNLSETTFVLPPDDPAHTARVRIFTPAGEIPFAGHPNVGTALVLAARAGGQPASMVFEELAGPVRIEFEWDGAAPRATVTAPLPFTRLAQVPVDVIAACAGLNPADVLTDLHGPMVASTGNPFAFAEVTPEALARASGDLNAMRRAATAHAVKATGFSLHLHAAYGTGRRTRMFAPMAGIIEDPATGSANVTLAALLLSQTDAPDLRIILEQGVEMGRPSILYAAAWREGAAIRASIGGSAVPVMRGVLTV